MKRHLLFLFGLIISTLVLAQTPQGISYQAVMRDAENNLIVESPIGLQVSIIQGTHDGNAVYVETHQVTSNQNGLITYIIGDGSVVTGVFEEIDWGSGPYWLETKADPTGGENYSITGTTRFFSVPYSLYAEFAGHAETFAGLDALLARIEALEEALEIVDPSLYHLHLLAYPPHAGTVTGYGEYEEGDEVTIAAIANEGWEFVNWSGDTEHLDNGDSADVIVTMPAESISLTANFQEKVEPTLFSLHLEVHPEGAGTVLGEGEYEEGELVNVTATANEGWEFVNWTGDTEYLDVVSSAETIITMPAENAMLTANFEMTDYSLALTANPSEGGVVTGAGIYNFGDEVLITATANEGWEFVEWTGETDFVDNPDSNQSTVTMPAENISLSANFQEVEIPETFIFIDEDFQGYTDHHVIEENGWTAIAEEGERKWICRTMNGNHFAQATAFNSNDDQNIMWMVTPAVDVGNSTQPVLEFLSAQAFYTHDGFSVYIATDFDGSDVHNATWESLPATLAGADDPAHAWIESGTIDLNGYSGIIHIAWRYEGSHPDGNTGSFRVNNVLLYDATYTPFNLELDVSPSGSGIVTGDGHYVANSSVSISAEADTGWQFINWTGDTEHLDDPNAANTTVTMPEQNISLTANFHVEYDPPEIVYGEGVTDIDGNYYVTVIIGDQEWMAENLRVTRYNNGDDLPTGLSDANWETTADGAYAIYPHDTAEGIDSSEEMVAAYGKLYNWHAVNDARGLCPTGWYVPSDDEWTQMVSYIVDQGFPDNDIINGSGNALKSCRQVYSPFGGDCDTSEHPRWDPEQIHNYHGFDAFGFTALPSGFRSVNEGYLRIGEHSTWWSATEYSNDKAWHRFLRNHNGNLNRQTFHKNSGYTIRCIKD